MARRRWSVARAALIGAVIGVGLRFAMELWVGPGLANTNGAFLAGMALGAAITGALFGAVIALVRNLLVRKT